MLIFCCIRSPSLCTLALHIAGSLWRLDFNHSVPFSGTLLALTLPPPARATAHPPRSFIRCTCIIAYGRFICLPRSPTRPRLSRPLASEGEGETGVERGGKSRCTIRITFLPAGYFSRLLPSCLTARRMHASRVFSNSHVLLAAFTSSLRPPHPPPLSPPLLTPLRSGASR